MRSFLIAAVMFSMCAPGAHSQSIHQKETFRGLSNPQIFLNTLPGPQHLKDHLADGKLKLSLQDAIYLTLENNSNLHTLELQVEATKYGVLRAHSPFDPGLTATGSAQRATSQSYTELAGASTVSSLTQTGEVDYAQSFETGTSVAAGFNASRLSTNSTYNYFNPSINSTLNLSVTQPLLRNRWLFANQAQLVIARRNLQQSRATFDAQVSDAILDVVQQYWSVVQARGGVEVQRKSLEAAEATYKRDKRALELGALPPLDIYRSEAEVASRKVSVIQAEYNLKQLEDQFRLTLGANLDPSLRGLGIDLTEQPSADGKLRAEDIDSALQRAMLHRPELEALHEALANDSTSIRLAHSNLLPDLRVTGTYSSSGLGGNLFDLNTTPPQLVSRGGFGDSVNQVFGFGAPTYGVGLSLNFPVRNRAAQAELGNALVSKRSDMYAERRLKEQIALQVSNAVHQLEQAELSMTAAKESLDLAQKNLAAEQRKYDLGAETIFFVLDAQSQVASAELTLLQAQVSYQSSLAAVDHSTGELLEPFHVKISELTH